MSSSQFSLVLTLTCRFSNWFHSGLAFFSMIWVHSWRCTSRTHQGIFCFATRCVHMRLQRLCLFWEPFCLRSEPPRKDPPGSSCSPLLQTCLLSTAQRHRPLWEDTGGISGSGFVPPCSHGLPPNWSEPPTFSGLSLRRVVLLWGMSSPLYTFSDRVAQRRVTPAGSSRLLSMSSWSSLVSLFSACKTQARQKASERQWAVGGTAAKFA